MISARNRFQPEPVTTLGVSPAQDAIRQPLASRWQALSNRLWPGNWPPLAWALLVLVLVASSATAVMGFELYSITTLKAQADTR